MSSWLDISCRRILQSCCGNLWALPSGSVVGREGGGGIFLVCFAVFFPLHYYSLFCSPVFKACGKTTCLCCWSFQLSPAAYFSRCSTNQQAGSFVGTQKQVFAYCCYNGKVLLRHQKSHTSSSNKSCLDMDFSLKQSCWSMVWWCVCEVTFL